MQQMWTVVRHAALLTSGCGSMQVVTQAHALALVQVRALRAGKLGGKLGGKGGS